MAKCLPITCFELFTRVSEIWPMELWNITLYLDNLTKTYPKSVDLLVIFLPIPIDTRYMFGISYNKVPKFSDTNYGKDLKFLDRHVKANSADPDQTAPRAAA